jgi:hypothetical protein
MASQVQELMSRLEEVGFMELNTLSDLSNFYSMLQDILLEYLELFASYQNITDQTALLCASIMGDTYKAMKK